MRRGLVAAASAVALIVSSLAIAAPPAMADGAGTVHGSFTLAVDYSSQGPVIALTVTANDTSHPGDTNFFVHYDITGPGWGKGSWGEPSMSSHTITYPIDFPQPGTDRVCVRVLSLSYPAVDASGYVFTSLGCKTVTLAPRALTIGVLDVHPNPTAVGVIVDGWVSDSWRIPPGYGYGTADATPAGQPYPAEGTSTTEPPDAAAIAAHPNTVGLTSFHVPVEIAGTSSVKLCVSATILPGHQITTVSAPCTTLTIASAEPVTPPTLSAPTTPTIGDVLAVTSAGTWTPDTVTLSTAWTRNSKLIAVTPALGSYTVSAADVGHQVCAVILAAVPDQPTNGYRKCVNVTMPGVTVTRVAGSDRFATAAAISTEAFPSPAAVDQVYVASGTGFADALSAGAAAAAHHQALLLTAADSLSAATRAELARLHPHRVVIVGGTSAISPHVLSAISAAVPGATVVRIGGANRYATSRAIVADAFPHGAGTVLVATGRDFPDAEASSGLAAQVHAPLLLTDGMAKTADRDTVAAVRGLHATTITILGGTGVVSAAVGSTLSTTATVTRLAGADRWATPTAIASVFSSAAMAYIADGYSFPDALSAASLTGAQPGPVYLSPDYCLPQGVIRDIARLSISHVVLLGGTAVLSSSVEALYACP